MSHATTVVTPHCHLPGRFLNKTDLARSGWRSGIPWPVSHLHGIGAKGTSSEQRWGPTTAQQRPSAPKRFPVSGPSCSPEGQGVWDSFSHLPAVFPAGSRGDAEWSQGQKGRWAGNRNSTSNCYQEEEEPQKLHHFLISSLPDTWLNSVVQWANADLYILYNM